MKKDNRKESAPQAHCRRHSPVTEANSHTASPRRTRFLVCLIVYTIFSNAPRSPAYRHHVELVRTQGKTSLLKVVSELSRGVSYQRKAVT